MRHQKLPIIIQGGMGAGVSSWSLARAVSKAGQLGVVSGTAIVDLSGRSRSDKANQLCAMTSIISPVERRPVRRCQDADGAG